MNSSVDPFTKNCPRMDIHGYDSKMAVYFVRDFINDNIMLKQYKIVIIHGKGTGILKRAVNNYLKTDKRVESFSVNAFNDGETIINIKR